MAFMSKKKKYKFQVEVCLKELLEVPFVSAVLFAKLRLLDGGFQDHSTREEVNDHTVKWNARFGFATKMLANASTGILDPCVLRISIRKEFKGGRSFTKLGFVDLNLAEFAGAGETCRKALLEGYDNRSRQDNSMLKFSLKMNMLSGDILFKVPSPSLKHKPVTSAEETVSSEPRMLDNYSSSSLTGSVASASSGFGSLPKSKRTPLLSSDLVMGSFNGDTNVPVIVAMDCRDVPCTSNETDAVPPGEMGHSRNSSNTSQLSKASGYSSINSHSRQSSSGDSGHIRNLHESKWKPVPSFSFKIKLKDSDTTDSATTPMSQLSTISSSSNEEYKTPYETFSEFSFDKPSNNSELRKSESCNMMGTINEVPEHRLSNAHSCGMTEGVLRSKSDFQIPRKTPSPKPDRLFHNLVQKSDSLFSFLTPNMRRKFAFCSTPQRSNKSPTDGQFKIPGSPIPNIPHSSLPSTRTTSPTLRKARTVRAGAGGSPNLQNLRRNMSHRKLIETGAAKLSPVTTNPDDEAPLMTASCDATQNRRASITTNPSSSSLVLSETGSLDRAKAALERRKKAQAQEADHNVVPGRVEVTRVNPDHLIAELLKNTNLEPTDDSGENSGLQLFIAKDGTAALGNHEVKSQMSTGVQVFKQVVMEDNR